MRDATNIGFGEGDLALDIPVAIQRLSNILIERRLPSLFDALDDNPLLPRDPCFDYSVVDDLTDAQGNTTARPEFYAA